MHSWGDGFKYFGDVGDAADEIGAYCRRWGRINVIQTKEKYGTVRVYCAFGCRGLHDLIWPGYVYIQYPKLYRLLTFPFFDPFRPFTYRWQAFIYRRAYKRALASYPHIREEILDCADWDEYLGGL